MAGHSVVTSIVGVATTGQVAVAESVTATPQTLAARAVRVSVTVQSAGAG